MLILITTQPGRDALLHPPFNLLIPPDRARLKNLLNLVAWYLVGVSPRFGR
jgi:hypothetical protein